jgi:hypothetical protein
MYEVFARVPNDHMTSVRFHPNTKTVEITRPYPVDEALLSQCSKSAIRVRKWESSWSWHRIRPLMQEYGVEEEEASRWKIVYVHHPHYLRVGEVEKTSLHLPHLITLVQKRAKTTVGKKTILKWMENPFFHLPLIRARQQALINMQQHPQLHLLRLLLSQVGSCPRDARSAVPFLSVVMKIAPLDGTIRTLVHDYVALWRQMKHHYDHFPTWPDRGRMDALVRMENKRHGLSSAVWGDVGGCLVIVRALKRSKLSSTFFGGKERYLVKKNKRKVWYTTAAVRTLQCSSFDPWKEKMEKEEELASRRFWAQCSPVIGPLFDRLGEMDATQAFATGSGVFPVVAPPPGGVDLVRMKHPLIPEVVPLTFRCKRGDRILLTGDSTSGKSTCVRTVLLACYLHQVGVKVPCDAASLPLLDAMWLVGMEKRDSWGQSSFRTHLRRLREVSQTVTSRSMVGLDEPCQGTNSREGTRVANDVLRRLAGTVLVSTHYLLEGGTKYHFEAFQLRPGAAAGRGAFHICRTLGIGNLATIAESYQEEKRKEYSIYIEQNAVEKNDDAANPRPHPNLQKKNPPHPH